MSEDPDPPRRSRAKLPAAVLALALASFFNDVGSEMCFPLLPVFLVSLGAGPTFLGIVEGFADATASFFKLFAGYLADRLPRYKPLVLVGYGLPCAVRPLLGFARAPWHVFGIRLTDRVGKGLRTAPRDALIAASMPSEGSGRAYGFQRAFDHAGGVVGPLVATGMLAVGFEIRTVFLAALVPSVLAVLSVACVREARRDRNPAHAAQATRERLPRSFSSLLAIIAVFSLANASDAFLLLRAKEVGVPTAALPLLWTVLHVSRVGSTLLGGHLADRMPRARLIAAGWVVFALCFLGMGFVRDAWLVWPLFVAYGLHTGLCEPAERALIRDLAPEASRGRAFGLFHGVVGACAIPAGLAMGAVWEAWSAQAALSIAAVVALAAAGALALWERRVK